MSKELNELIKELGKIVDGNQSIVNELDKLKSLYEKLKLETAEEFEYPFEDNQRYWSLNAWGDINSVKWENKSFDTEQYDQGHVFKTKEEATRERDKRALLVRFRQFRDKCNGDWKPNWNKEGNDDTCYNIDITYNDGQAVLEIDWHRYFNQFCLFGYFKEQKDVERAIELFGDEIIRLWVDE